MRVLIIEDELPASEKLVKSLQLADETIEIAGTLTSVKDTVHWLRKNPLPDLVVMDIELSDGLSFRIFDEFNVTCPVIFTTAFDEYWQEAFEHNSIDYLLKPVNQQKLETSLKKYKNLKDFFALDYNNLLRQKPGSTEYKKRFLVKRGMDYVSIKTEEIAYFYAAHKVVCLVNKQTQKYILEKSLNEIQKEISPSEFYRVNRKFLVNMNSIKRITAFAKSKLLLELDPPVTEEVIISQENVTEFKEWLEQ